MRSICALDARPKFTSGPVAPWSMSAVPAPLFHTGRAETFGAADLQPVELSGATRLLGRHPRGASARLGRLGPGSTRSASAVRDDGVGGNFQFPTLCEFGTLLGNSGQLGRHTILSTHARGVGAARSGKIRN
jgi:hypothetical protein